MRIEIRFAGSLRHLAGTSEMDVNLPENSSIKTLFDHLQDHLPDEFITQIIKPAHLNENAISTLITINRKTVPGQNLLEYMLEEDDSIAFVPPMEGG